MSKCRVREHEREHVLSNCMIGFVSLHTLRKALCPQEFDFTNRTAIIQKELCTLSYQIFDVPLIQKTRVE